MNNLIKKWNVYWEHNDPDAVFSYSTVKLVKIQDRRLGLLHHLFVIGVLLYLIIGVMLIQKNYMKRESPIGSFMVDVDDPLIFKNANTLPYCGGSTCNQNPNPDPKMKPLCCVYWDSRDTVYQPMADGFLLTTRTEEIHEIRSGCTAFDFGCKYDMINGSFYEYYSSQAEDFMIDMHHTVQGRTIDLSATMGSMDGELMKRSTTGQYSKFKTCAPGTKCRTTTPGSSDTFVVSEFLQAAGIQLDDRALNSQGGQRTQTNREVGFVLVVEIRYSNEFSFNWKAVKYEYRPRFIKGSTYHASQAAYNTFPGDRLVLTRHGIRIVFVRSGLIGMPDLQTVFIQLVSGLALMSIATAIVDNIALKFLPQRKHYKGYKYEDTIDFSDLRDGLVDAERTRDVATGSRAILNKYAAPQPTSSNSGKNQRM